ncbi:uncharacterized protein AAG666_020307 isoform 1-T3 [Megaptera novaeangliae]
MQRLNKESVILPCFLSAVSHCIRFSEGSAQKSLGSVFVSQPQPLMMRLGLLPGRYSYHLDVLLSDLQNNSARELHIPDAIASLICREIHQREELVEDWKGKKPGQH